MKRILLLLGAAFMSLLSLNSFGQACLTDNAGNAAYSDGWQAGDNGGSGFNAWTRSTTSGNGGQNGFFTGNSGNNGGSPNIGTSCWAMYANSGQTASAVRPFGTALAVGHSISFQIDNGNIQNGGTVGMALQNASSENLMEFYFVAGQSNYILNDGTNSNTATSLAFTNGGLTIKITRTGTSTYNIDITRLAGGSQSFTSRSFKSPGGGQVPAQLRFFNANAGAGGASDYYFNNLSICRPTISTTGSLSAVSTTYGTASSNTSFNLSGAEMFEGVTVSAPSGFQVSTNPSSGFASSIVVGSAGTISSTPVYLRLSSTAPVAGSYNSQNVVLSSTGASSVNVTTTTSGNTVSPKSISASLSGSPAKNYDGNTTAPLGSITITLSGVVNGDPVTASGTAASYDNKDVAGSPTKQVTVTGLSLSGGGAGNYTLSSTSASANIGSINALGVTVTPDAGQNKVFAAADPVLTYTASPSLISPDVFSGALGRAGGEAIGFYNYNLGTLSAGSNYSLSLGGSNTFEIVGIGQSTADFRSQSAGNFSSASIWQYDQGGNSWVNATQAPGSNNNVSISHAVTLDQDFTVGAAKSFTLASGGSFTVNPDRTLTITGSADFGGQAVTFKSDATGYGSLGQVNSLSGATNVTVERFIPNVGFRSWRLLSVPTSGSQTIRQSWQENNAPFANGTPGFGTLITGGGNNTGASQALGFDFSGPNTSMLSWNGIAWSNISGTLGALSAKQAYFLYVRGDRSKGVTGLVTDAGSTTLRSNGSIYTGNQVIAASNTFSLIPNLYPSAINFTGLTRSGVANNYTIWDAKTQFGNQLGRYVTFSGTNGWEPNIGTVSYPANVANTTIESGQAFFVNGGAGATITLVETAKTSASANGNLGLRPLKRASLRTTLSNEEGELDGTVAVFDAALANAVDEEDAQKMGNPGANFAIEAAGKILSVEGRRTAAENDVVQFRMWNLSAGNYTLKLEAGNIAQAGLEAVLEDSYTKSVTPVQVNGSTTVNFTIDADAASKAASRFRLVFRKGISGVEATPAISVAPNPVTGGVLNLRFANQPEGRYTVRVTGLNGQVLLNRVLVHGGGNGNQVLNLGARFASGNYRLEVISPAKVRSVQPLLIKN